MELKFVIFCLVMLSPVLATVIHIPGDVTIIGMFRIWETDDGRCTSNIDVNSVIVAESVKWYIQQLNREGGLPFTIGLKVYGTCGLPSEAARVTVDILNKEKLNNDTIIGIVGPELSQESRTVSSILSAMSGDQMIPQVGFSATDVTLGDSSKYPNYVRVVPNNAVQIQTMIHTMLELNWNRISIVYEDNDYGRDGAERLQASVRENNICVSKQYPIDVSRGVDTGEVSLLLNDIIYGIDSRPSASGIVLFATSKVIHTVFQIMSALKLTPVPIVLVSDGLGMNDKRLHRQYGVDERVIPEAKGTLAVVPPYLEITEFWEYWKHTFTNTTQFETETLTNPHLIDVYRSVTGCDDADCDFSPVVNVDAEFSTQPLYVQYAVVASHALIKSVHKSLNEHCSPGYNGVCSDFQRDFKLNEIINNLKGIQLRFDTDFLWRLPSLSIISHSWRIGADGELYRSYDEPSYEVYNYQAAFSNGDSNNFELVQVGIYAPSGLTIHHEKLRDYNGVAGAEKTWPDVRKAQCPVGKLCAECLPISQLQETVYYRPGDLYVVGVVPVYNTDDNLGCGNIRLYPGYQAAEVMKYSIESVNNKTESFANFYPGVKIGLIILNSCNNPVVIQRKIYNLHNEGVKLANGKLFTLDIDKVIGYIGEVNSDITIAMAEVLTMLPFVQISYGSTSDRLSDRERYPQFMRVVTPVTPQAEAIVELVKHTNSNYIQIVHSDTVYGNNGRDSILKAAGDNKICVIQTIPFQEDENEYNIYDKLRRYPHAKLVVVFLQSYKIVRFIRAILSQMTQGEFIFIGSQTWHHTKDLLDIDTNHDLLGSYSLAFEIKQDPRLLERIRSIKPKPFSKDPWVTQFLQARGNCYYDDSYDKTQPVPCSSTDNQYQLDYLDTYVYIATISLLTGANSYLQNACPPDNFACVALTENVPDFIQEIRKVKLDLDGSGLDMYVFNENNNGNIGFRVYNIQKDKTDVSKLVYEPVGRYSLNGRFDFSSEKIIYPSNQPMSSTCPNKLACNVCDLEDEITPLPEEKTGLGTSTILGIVLAVFGVATIVLVIVIVIIVRKPQKDEYITATWGDDVHRAPPDPCPHPPIQTTDQ